MNRRTRHLLIVAAIAAVALIIMAAFAPRMAAAGWLVAFTMVSAVPLGGLAWIMIHRLTGGRWGDALMPVLLPLARCTPLLLLLVLPILIATPLLWPWTARIGDVTPSVGAVYLNTPSFIVRTLIALIGWSALSILVPHNGNRLLAGLGLVFHAVAVSATALDWNLAIEPPFFSTSFGASIAVMQLSTALAVAAIVGIAPRDRSDLGGLMLTTTLGFTYIDFMAVLVIWYGNLPHKVFWFVERLAEPWLTLAIASFIVGSVIPVAALMFASLRASRNALRAIGICILASIALYQTWIVAPAFGVAAIGGAAIALIVMAALIAASVAAGWWLTWPMRGRPVHGR